MQPEPPPHSTLHQHLNIIQYITHWVPTSKFLQQNNIKKPFIKLRKFSQQNFSRKHQQTINSIMIQRLYLIAVALINGVQLKLSNQYYWDHKTGFIYGVYQFRKQGQEDIGEKMGVKMGRDVGMAGTDCFYDCIENYVEEYCHLIDRLNFNMKGQYEDFAQNFRKIFYANAQKSQNISPQQFLTLFEHWPIAEHHVFTIKLKNSFILPTIIQHVSLSTQLRELQKIQKSYLPELIQKCQGKSETIAKIMLEFEDKIHKIFKQLEREGKIIQPKINATKPIIKQINKDYKELKIVCDFLVLLSPSRSQVVINERPIEEGLPESPSSKTITKITIMPLNGSMAPISGNVLSINWTWQFSLVPIPFISSKVQCFNNRKLEQTYFEQFQNFWHCLQSTPSFQDIIGSDKYTVSLNSKNKMEILFANHIPSIALSQIFKQIDKIIGLTVTMDSVVELCERKGTENQDPQEYPIQKFLQEQAIGKFQRVLATVNTNWKNIMKL